MGDQSNKTNSCITLGVAIIGALAVILAALLNHEKIVDIFLNNFTTKEISVPASDVFSGGSAGSDLLTFSETQNINGLGDTKSDSAIKSFLSFSLEDLPGKAEILDASLKIQCTTLGNPEKFGKLILQEYAYGVYDETVFLSIPQYEQSWHITWSYPDGLLRLCNSQGFFTISGKSLVQIVQEHISEEYIQFVFYFENQTAIANQANDSVTFTGPPVLNIKYHEIP